MCRHALAGAILAAAVTAMSAAGANAQQFEAKLSGFNETPAVFSQGQATFKSKLNTKVQSLTYTLTYSGLSGSIADALLHFSKARVEGGVIAFLCGTATNPGPTGTPTCPSPSGTVTGTITGGSIIGPTAQGIAVGNFGALTAALLSESVYASIHTTQFPGGELRGQIHQPEDQQGQNQQ